MEKIQYDDSSTAVKEENHERVDIVTEDEVDCTFMTWQYIEEIL